MMVRHGGGLVGSAGRTTDRFGMARSAQVLDRLVGGAVLAETDRVVRPDVDGVDVHQRASRTAGRM